MGRRGLVHGPRIGLLEMQNNILMRNQYFLFKGIEFTVATNYILDVEIPSAGGNLYLALDQAYFPKEKIKELYSDLDRIQKMISGFIKYLWNL